MRNRSPAKRAAPSPLSIPAIAASAPPPVQITPASQPPVPSRAAVQAAQQQMASVLGKGASVGAGEAALARKPKAAPSQPPVPSRAAVKAAQQQFAGVASGQARPAAVAAVAKASQPPVPSRAAVSAAQQQFAGVASGQAKPAVTAPPATSATSTPPGAHMQIMNSRTCEQQSYVPLSQPVHTAQPNALRGRLHKVLDTQCHASDAHSCVLYGCTEMLLVDRPVRFM